MAFWAVGKVTSSRLATPAAVTYGVSKIRSQSLRAVGEAPRSRSCVLLGATDASNHISCIVG